MAWPPVVPRPAAAASLTPVLPPTVKVPLYRVDPNGTMHATKGGGKAK